MVLDEKEEEPLARGNLVTWIKKGLKHFLGLKMRRRPWVASTDTGIWQLFELITWSSRIAVLRITQALPALRQEEDK